MNKFIKLFLLTLSILMVSCTSQLTTEEYIQSGQALLKNEDWKGAIIEFKNAVKQSPDNAQARALLGEAYLGTYSSDAAIKELKRAIGLDNKNGALLVFLGKAYEQKNENDQILSELKVNASSSAFVKADIHALRAKALLRSGKINEAKTELDLAKSLDDKRTEVRLAWAQYEKGNKNTKAQRQWLEPLLEKDGGIADAWSEIAQLEQDANEFDKAEKAYTRAISLRKIVHLDYVKRALLRIGQKNYDGANEDIAILKKAGATWPMVGHAEGLIAYLQKDFDLAQTKFESVLSRYPDYSPSQLLMGLTHFNKNNYQNAVANLELYRGINPDNQQANFIYAASQIKLGKASVAIPVLQKLNKQYPGDFKVLSLLGNAFLQNNQLDKSINMLKKAVEINPSQASARLQLGGALMREKSGLVAAQQQLIKAIELDPELFEADLALYLSYMRSKDFTNARKIAENLTVKQADTSLGANLKALSFLADNNKQQAVSELEKTLVQFPSDSLTSNNLARIFIQDNELAKAKDLYLSVLKKNPDDLKSMNQMALIAAKENDQASVIDWLKKAVDKNPDSLSAKLLLASQYLSIKEAKLAVQLLQNVKAEDKEIPNYILIMAKAKMETGEYQHATRLLKSLISREPALSSAQFLLAQSYAYQNDKGNLRQALNETLKISPEHLSANLMLARLDLIDNNVDEFKKRVAKLNTAYPQNKDVQLLFAKVESSEKGYDSAITTLKEIMSETPHSEVVIDLAKNQWVIGDKNGAISGLELWLQDNPTDKRVLMTLAQFYILENRTEEAKKTYRDLDKVLPDNPLVLNNIAWLIMDTDLDQGIVYAEKALKIKPESPFIKDTLAMLYLKNSEFAKALDYSKQAVKSAPNNLEIQINYSKILSANGHKALAKENLRNIMNKNKNIEVRKTIQGEMDQL